VRNLKYKSNRKEVKKAMDGAKRNMLEAIGKAGEGYVKLVTPVGVYTDGRVGGSLRDSIAYNVDNNAVYVGSTLTSEMYPIYVHKGTRFQKSQPYLHDGVMKNLAALKSIAERNYKL
jgi:hypothetical protein